jgi:hypothetical protein
LTPASPNSFAVPAALYLSVGNVLKAVCVNHLPQDLEDLYHPFDPSQELEPEAFAPLVLWCASNSFHETLVAVTDEIVFRGVSCPLRTLLDATNRLAGPSGLLTSAAMSRSQQTFDAVSHPAAHLKCGN